MATRGTAAIAKQSSWRMLGVLGDTGPRALKHDVTRPPMPGARAMSLKHVNAVIVGAGAGGGVVRQELATGGLSVVLLERGRW